MDKNMEEYNRYIKKCEMLGTKMFEFEVGDRGITIERYIENKEPYRIVKIPGFVDEVQMWAFKDVRQDIKITGNKINFIGFNSYAGGTLDINELNIGKMENMNSMFFQCKNIKELDLDRLDTSETVTMSGIFTFCSSLKKLNISKFNTSKVIDMAAMFSVCKNLKEIDLSNFDTSKVYDMFGMFNECVGIKELNLENFNTSMLKRSKYMFKECKQLEKLDISNFDTRNIKEYDSMFWGCNNIKLIITNKRTKQWLNEKREEIQLRDKCEIVVK